MLLGTFESVTGDLKVLLGTFESVTRDFMDLVILRSILSVWIFFDRVTKETFASNPNLVSVF